MTTIFEKIYRIYNTTLYLNYCNLDNVGSSIIPYKGFWDFDKVLNTEEDYEKNYGNHCSEVFFKRVIIKLETGDDKVSMKLFTYFNHRRVGKKFFRKETSCKFLTYNLKTNLLYDGDIKNYHLKRKFSKKIRTVNFHDKPIQKFISYFWSMTHSFSEYGFYTKDDVFELLNLFLKNIPGLENYMDIDSQERLYKFMLDKRGVKLPNNWLSFRDSQIQPKKVDYIKNNFKYVDTLMSIHHLTGDKIRRVLHQVDSFNINTWKSVVDLFGEDYIKTKNDNFIRSIFETSYLPNSTSYLPDILNKKELDNAFEIFKHILLGDVDTWTFFDHIRFYTVLKGFGEKVKWTSKTYTEFSNEHLIWTELYTSYTRGSFERVYSQSFIDNVTNKITTDSDYYPVVLVNSIQYNDESAKQSNCVRSYIDSVHSLIISLRKDSLDSDDRATIEYRIKINSYKKIKLERIQTLGKFNQKLNPTWDEPIEILDRSVYDFIKKNNFELPKLIKETKKGVVRYNSEITESGYEYDDTSKYFLRWDDNVNMNNVLPYLDF